MDRPTCKTCPHWRSHIHLGCRFPGQCRRYPAYVDRGENEWCGEHPGFPAYIQSQTDIAKVQAAFGIMQGRAPTDTGDSNANR